MIDMWRQWRDHSNERPFDPPTADVTQVEPRKPTSHREPDLSGVIEPDQELEDAHRFDPDEAYRLAAHVWGHEVAVSWSAYVAGLPRSHKWTHRELRDLLFLRWQYEHGLS